MVGQFTIQEYKEVLQSLASQWENLLKATELSDTKYWELYERSKAILITLCTDTSDFLGQLSTSPTSDNIKRFIGKLRATQLDLGKDWFNLKYRIQEKITIDLMQQADDLLAEGGTTTHGHIPAAVLAGAVLENFLRALCVRQEPPIAVINGKGTYKTLGMLVGELEKIKFFSPLVSQQIKVWVAIRNSAAHGQFDEVNAKQVRDMIDWIREFIQEHQVKG